MSDATQATQQTIQTLTEAEAYLRERAPIDASAAPKIVRKIHRAFVSQRYGRGNQLKHSLDHFKILRTMRPYLSKSLDSDTLLEIADTARQQFEDHEDKQEAEKSARMKAAGAVVRERRERERAAERAEKARRAENAEFVKAVAGRFKVTIRRAQQLLKEGTTNPTQAAGLAEVTNGGTGDFLRQPAKPGRNADNDTWLMRRYWDGASFRDFVREPPGLEGTLLKLLYAFSDAYALNKLPDHLKELEAVTTFAQLQGMDANVAIDLWSHYVAWRRERIATIILDGTRDPYDFG